MVHVFVTKDILETAVRKKVRRKHKQKLLKADQIISQDNPIFTVLGKV